MRQQPMARAEIDDASAAEQPAHAPRHLPCFVELLAREAARAADGAGQPIEERVTGKAREIAGGETSA